MKNDLTEEERAWRLDRIAELKKWYTGYATTEKRKVIVNSVMLSAVVCEVSRALGSSAALDWISKEVNAGIKTLDDLRDLFKDL